MDEHTRANQELWDELTGINFRSEFYDVNSFKAGKSTLKSLELEELGDVKGKSLLHLQCHFGMDSLSWAREGAEVTAIDFSEKAIELARALSEDIGIPAIFLQSNIYELPENLNGQFDIVFTSYGVLNWLPDLKKWASVIHHFLKPGGTFYIIEGHPFAWVFEDDADSQSGFKVGYPYFQNEEPLVEETQGSYAERSADVKQPVSYQWNHGMAGILNAIIGVGLHIEFVHEFPFCNWPMLEVLQMDKDGWWHFEDESLQLPLVFSLKATKL